MASGKETPNVGASGGTGQRWLSSSSEDVEKSSTPSTYVDKSMPDTKRNSLDGDDTEMERRTSMVQALAQTYSRASRGAAPGSDPFHAGEDSPLNPASPNFSARAWCKAIADMTTQDGGAFRSSGICFEDLNVHGFGASTDYQKDMLNLLLSFAGRVTDAVGGKRQRIDILRDFDGVVNHGEMLVVLGPPGSGCSTFLKTIAGEMNGIFVDETSYFNYQGISFQEMHTSHRGEAIYTAEVDVHFPQLTVGETLTFAARARQPRRLPDGVSSSEFATHFRDVTMAMYGISHTIDTRVGNEFIRGVSGGERKRVTISEATLSGAPLQCWDNSTRGLDAANAVEFCKTLRLQTELFDTAAVVSIYQAPQSAYDRFDKATVLYEGRQIYFGRADAAKQYFIDLGFECPPRQTTPDFLTSMTSPQERIVRPGFEGRAPRTPDEFVAAWKKSDAYKALKAEMAQYKQNHPIGGPDAEVFRASRRAQQAKAQRKKSPFTLSYSQQIKLCLWRGWRRLVGDPSVTVGGIIANSILALIVGSVFYNLPQTSSSFFKRGSLIFFACLLNAFASALELLTLYAQRPIVEKHSRYALYHPSAEAVASMLCDLPNKVANAIVTNLIIYFMSNLNRTPGAFFFFLLMSFMAVLVMSMIFRFIGSASRTLFQALIPAAVLILALVIFTGFIIPFNYMLGWCRWIRWINPLNYVFESLMVNEFHGRQFRCDSFIPSKAFPEYQHVPAANQVCDAVGSVPGQEYIDGGVYIQSAYSYEWHHRWRNFGIVIAFIVGLLALYMVAAELVSEKKSKGEVLVYRKGHKPAAAAMAEKRRHDPEAAMANIGPILTSERTKDGVLVAQNSVFQWHDVCYDVKVKGETRRILDNVDGWVKPGSLTALMGVSGAGKTTLLDCLADRVSMGVITGEMLVDGRPRDMSFQRKTGYVQQQDLHLQTTTVREALNFSALLRQPAHIPREEKLAYVDEVIKLLEMQEYADAVVGVPGEGLNIEQRKRLTIGVELAAKPPLLLFVDEPTSGLDSQTSWAILDLLEKLTKAGQAVLCTIHQPSAMLFQRFDRLLFLAKGGKTVYFGDIGENSQTMTSYFERNGGHACPPDANPAEWMLDVIGAAPGSHSDIDWFDTWRTSPEYRRVQEELEGVKREKQSEAPAAVVDAQADATSFDEFAVPLTTQFREVTHRVFQQYWRTPVYLYSKLALCTLSTLFIGFVFFHAKNTKQGLQNQMFAVFQIFFCFGQMAQQTMPQFVIQRSLYEVRERPSKVYSWKVFMLSQIVVELPWNALVSVFMFFTWYYPIGLYRNAEPTDAVTERGALMWLFMLAFMLLTSTVCAMVIAGLDSAEAGGNLINVLVTLCIIFCGVLAPGNSLPGFWKFMYRVSPFTYLVSGMLSTGLANTEVVCAANEFVRLAPPANMTCGQYLGTFVEATRGNLINPESVGECVYCPMHLTNDFLAALGIHYSNRWRDFGLMWVYIGFNVAAALFIYWLARVPKKPRLAKSKQA